MPGGRPSKLTPETTKKLIDAIKIGATYEHASQYAGISYPTLRRWMVAGEKANKGEYHDFYNSVKKAESDAVVISLAEIKKAVQDGTWQAAAWLLERRYPNDYGRQIQRVEHTGEMGVNVAGITNIRENRDEDDDAT